MVRSSASPMPDGPTTSLRTTAHCDMFCSATVWSSHGNRLSILFSLCLQVRRSSSAWLLALKKWTSVASSLRSWAASSLDRHRSMDNTGSIALLEHGHFKGRSKHVHLHWCFVCDYVDTGVLRLVQTPSRDQLADIDTKACSVPQFKFQCSLLRGG